MNDDFTMIVITRLPITEWIHKMRRRSNLSFCFSKIIGNKYGIFLLIVTSSPGFLIYPQEKPQNLIQANLSYADSVLNDHYGSENISFFESYVEQAPWESKSMYRLVGIKNQGLLIVDITRREWITVMGFVSSGGKEIIDISQRGSYLYWIQQNPLELVIINMMIPFEPIVVNYIKISEFDNEREQGQKTSIQIEESSLKVIAEEEFNTQLIASFNLKSNPASPILLTE